MRILTPLVLALITISVCISLSSQTGIARPMRGSQLMAQAPGKQWSSPPEMSLEAGKSYTATVTTSAGTMVLDLFAEEVPKTVNNFVFLANEDFYDGVIFHRVIENFMIQGGDPTGTGTGGPGYRFEDEAVNRPYTRGTLAMANAGPNTNGSQFFIMHRDYRLPPSYTIFGELIEGEDVLDAIATAQTGRRDRPVEPVMIEDVEIEVEDAE